MNGELVGWVAVPWACTLGLHLTCNPFCALVPCPPSLQMHYIRAGRVGKRLTACWSNVQPADVCRTKMQRGGCTDWPAAERDADVGQCSLRDAMRNARGAQHDTFPLQMGHHLSEMVAQRVGSRLASSWR